MYTWWALVKTTSNHGYGETVNGFIRVTVQAASPYLAEQMLRGMYGDRLMSGVCRA